VDAAVAPDRKSGSFKKRLWVQRTENEKKELDFSGAAAVPSRIPMYPVSTKFSTELLNLVHV
jgi:hypothetical protein